MSVTSRSIEKANRRLKAIPAAVREAVYQANEKSIKEMADLIEQGAPELTGDLKWSVETTGPGKRTPAYSQPGGSTTVPENGFMVTVGNTEVRYPHMVEYGTADAPAQPFFWPAVRLLRTKATRAARRAMRKATKDTAK